MLHSAPGDGRFPAIDAVKAAAIVAVSLTHSGLPPWVSGYSRWDYWICGVVVNFQVPAFLFASGFLYYRPHPLPHQVATRRLSRVLVPYLVASGAAYALGLARPAGAREVLVQLATGSALGIYYFVFLLAMFIPTIWVLSRLGPRPLVVLCGALWAVAVITEAYVYAYVLERERPPTLEGFFWLSRSPLNFTYAMFVSGWLAAARLERLRALAAGRPAEIAMYGLAAIAVFLVAAGYWPWATGGLLRMLYTLALLALIALACRTAPVPAAVRFLSSASLGLYLYHHMFQIPLEPLVRAWSPPLRIATLGTAGLVGAALLCRLGTAILGRRARTLLGA